MSTYYVKRFIGVFIEDEPINDNISQVPFVAIY
jgi:hypothetical protein